MTDLFEPLIPLVRYLESHLNATAAVASDSSLTIGPASLRLLSASELPLAASQLLAHDRNMTPTLEGFYARGACSLHVISVTHSPLNAETPTRLSRVINLHIPPKAPPALSSAQASSMTGSVDSGRENVEFACIDVHLPTLPAPVQASIVAAEAPFGTILLRAGVQQTMRVGPFFALSMPEQEAAAATRLPLPVPPIVPAPASAVGSAEAAGAEHGQGRVVLYGRCNCISTPASSGPTEGARSALASEARTGTGGGVDDGTSRGGSVGAGAVIARVVEIVGEDAHWETSSGSRQEQGE